MYTEMGFAVPTRINLFLTISVCRKNAKTQKEMVQFSDSTLKGSHLYNKLKESRIKRQDQNGNLLVGLFIYSVPLSFSFSFFSSSSLSSSVYNLLFYHPLSA